MDKAFVAALWTSTKLLIQSHMRRLQKMEVPIEMAWSIITSDELVTDRVRTCEGNSEIIHSTTGVKQGCQLSPTLFELYIDKIFGYIDRGGRQGEPLAGL